MTDPQVQAKLNQLVVLCNELHEEAERRYGREASLFFESGGGFCIMDGDTQNSAKRPEHIKFQSRGYCKLTAGVW